MAIKINLLPQSYALEKARNRWIAAMAALLGVTGLGIGLLYASDKKQLEKVVADRDAAQAVANLTTAAQTAAKTATDATASIKGVVDFMADASKTGQERAALIDLLRRYIYQYAVVSDMDLAGGTGAKITVTVRSPDEYARFLLALRKGAPDATAGATASSDGKVFSSPPVASGVPGFSKGYIPSQAPNLSDTPQQIVFPFQINAAGNLKTDATNARNNLMYVPAEPPGTLVAGGGGAGAGGGGSASSASLGSGSAQPSASPIAR